MRNAVLALGLVILSAGPAWAQSAWADKIFLATGTASHDFGTVPRGAQLKHRFLVKNIYKVPLEITSIRVSCGCVTLQPNGNTQYVRAENLNTPVLSLRPNQQSFIDINMDARLFSGSKTVSIYVTVGPQFVSTATLTVTAVARQDVVFNPGTVDFGIVQAGQTPTQILDVEYSGNLTWQIVEVVKNSSAPFQVKVEELYRQEPRFRTAGRVGYRFNVTLKANAPPGAFKQEIILKTNDPNSPTLTVSVEGTVQGSLTVAPGIVNFGSLKKGDKAEKRVIVQGGSRPFRILGVDGLEGGLSVEVKNEAKARHTLIIRCEPTQAGEVRKLLLIRTDLDRESVTVSVEASVNP
jgi:hypothetical protein